MILTVHIIKMMAERNMSMTTREYDVEETTMFRSYKSLLFNTLKCFNQMHYTELIILKNSSNQSINKEQPETLI